MVVAHNTDTSTDAEAVQLELLLQLPPSQRLEKALALSCELIRLSKAAIRRRHPNFSEDEVALKFIELTYGTELAESVRTWRSGARD